MLSSMAGSCTKWSVVKKVYSGLKGSVEHHARRLGWEDVVSRPRSIQERGLPLANPAKLNRLLEEAEACVKLAGAREALKRKSRLARLPGALRLLFRGEYERRAHGMKTLLQDLLIP